MTTATKERQILRDVMTANPITVRATESVVDAAMAMAGAEVGPIPVVDDQGMLCGLITDRDITVRVVAAGRDPSTCQVSDACSGDVQTLTPDATVDEAIELMRSRALRRVPVVENNRVVGIVSLGDLAQERDPMSALADISKAPPND